MSGRSKTIHRVSRPAFTAWNLFRSQQRRPEVPQESFSYCHRTYRISIVRLDSIREFCQVRMAQHPAFDRAVRYSIWYHHQPAGIRHPRACARIKTQSSTGDQEVPGSPVGQRCGPTPPGLGFEVAVSPQDRISSTSGEKKQMPSG